MLMALRSVLAKPDPKVYSDLLPFSDSIHLALVFRFSSAARVVPRAATVVIPQTS